MIKKYVNSGETIKIYNTDDKFVVNKFFYNYYIDRDMSMMLEAIDETKGTRKRSADEFIGYLYPEEEYRKYHKEYLLRIQQM